MTAPQWRRASSCTSSGNCVEAAPGPGGSVLLRDSKDPGGAVLQVSRGAFGAFLAAAKIGVLDSLLQPPAP